MDITFYFKQQKKKKKWVFFNTYKVPVAVPLILISVLTAKHFPIEILGVVSLKIGFHKQNFINEKTIYGYPDSVEV